MRKILCALITVPLSFTLLIGCQSNNMANNEKTAAMLVSFIDSIGSQADNLSPDSKAEYVSLAKEIEEYVKKINSNPNEFDSQEKIDKITEQYNIYIEKIENIAEENSVTLEYDTHLNNTP